MLYGCLRHTRDGKQTFEESLAQLFDTCVMKSEGSAGRACMLGVLGVGSAGWGVVHAKRAAPTFSEVGDVSST